jgi:DNA-binding IclR family transcriptional regulator
MGLNRIDIALLDYLATKGYTSRLQSATAADICDSFDMSKKTIQRRLMAMIGQGYIGCGFSDGRSHTYFVSSKGIRFYEEVIGE